MAAKRKFKTVPALEEQLTTAQEATARTKKENERLSEELAKARKAIATLEARLEAILNPKPALKPETAAA